VEIAIVARPYVADIYRDQEICNQLIEYEPERLARAAIARAQACERLAVGVESSAAEEVCHSFTAAKCIRCRLVGPGTRPYSRNARLRGERPQPYFETKASTSSSAAGEILPHETVLLSGTHESRGVDGCQLPDETFMPAAFRK